MATLKDMKRILSFLFSAWLCVPIIDTFSSAINTNGLSGLEHGSMNFCHMLVQIWRDWYIWRRPCSKFSRVHRWDHRTPNFSWQNWRFSCTLRCHQWLENPSEFLKKKLHENRELLVGGLFAVPTSLVAVLVGATFPATGLRCLKKSGAVLESPGGTECCECCECEWDTGEGNSYFFFLIRMCISVWWFHVVVSYLQLYLFLFIGI